MAATADQMAGYTGRLDSEMAKWEKQVRRYPCHGGACIPAAHLHPSLCSN